MLNGSDKLSENVDYSITCESYVNGNYISIEKLNIVNPGSYRLIITGTNNYTGKVARIFQVEKVPQSLNITGCPDNIYVGMPKFQLNAIGHLDNNKILWSCNNEEAATVDEYGYVMIYKSCDEVEISASACGDEYHQSARNTIKIKINAASTPAPTETPEPTGTPEPTAMPEPTATPVAGKIYLDNENFWDRLLDTITFGLIKSSGTEVSIETYIDNALTYYYIEKSGRNEVYSEEVLSSESVIWKEYKEPFMLDSEKNVVYAGIVEPASGTYYLCSDGIVVNAPTEIPVSTQEPIVISTAEPKQEAMPNPTEVPTNKTETKSSDKKDESVLTKKLVKVGTVVKRAGGKYKVVKSSTNECYISLFGVTSKKIKKLTIPNY